MKSIKIGSIIAFTLWLFAGPLWASDINVELSVDKPTLGQDDELQLEVAVEGAQGVDSPEVSGLQAFAVQNSGSSTQVQVINGTTTLRTTFSYALTPKTLGTFSLGPASVTVGGKKYSSNTVSVQVTKSAGTATASSAGDDGASGSAGYRITATVDNKSPYVNEQILYTFKFYARGMIQNAQLSLPEFTGFAKEQIGKQRDSRELVNGVTYNVTEIKLALTPLSAGSVSISPAVLTGEVFGASPRGARPRRRSRGGGLFDEFFEDPWMGLQGELKRVRLRSESLTLNVRPVPAAGRPGDFSGLVGQFRLDAALGKTSVAVGDSTTLSLKLSGEGNVRDARLPSVDWKGFKTYEDKPTLQSDAASGRLTATKTFKIALVPLAAGKQTLPTLRFPYFDTKSGKYAVAETPALSLDVSPGSGPEALSHVTAGTSGTSQKDVKVQGEDVMPLKHEWSEAGRPLDDTERGWLWCLILGLPVLYGVGCGYARLRARRWGDADYQRREKAWSVLQRALREKTPGATDDEALSRHFRLFLGDKLGFDAKALTPADTQRILLPLGVSAPLVKQIEEILKRLEQGRYGGRAVSPDDVLALREEVLLIARELQSEKRK